MKISSFQFLRNHIYFKFTLLLVVIICSATSCGDDTEPKPESDSLNKILPLGASRVEGARPAFESYRYELWKLMVQGDWEFDFIGTETDGANYEEFQDLAFDPDHEGRGGWTSGMILNNLESWLENSGTPDIVLFSSPGGNDILNGQASITSVVSNVNEIIDILQEVNPNVDIIIEMLAPGKSDFMTEQFQTAFDQMQSEVTNIANAQSTSSSRVLTVDMHTGFNDDLLADDVHYNEAGASFIASRYYEVLEGILN